MNGVRTAVAAIRAWTALYTWGLPRNTRERRCAEIDSDVWEFLNDHVGSSAFVLISHMSARLVFGMPADLLWRSNHLNPRSRQVAVAAVATILVLIAWWMLEINRAAALPTPPGGLMQFVSEPPPAPEP